VAIWKRNVYEPSEQEPTNEDNAEWNSQTDSSWGRSLRRSLQDGRSS
jgi:protein subunit release factor B